MNYILILFKFVTELEIGFLPDITIDNNHGCNVESWI